MGTCKECRFYQEAGRNFVNVKTCTCPKVLFATSKFVDDDDSPVDKRVAIGSKRTDGHELSGDECGVMDGSDYAAWLMPCPDFGCIHFQHLEGYVPHFTMLSKGDPDYGVRKASMPCTVEWPALTPEAGEAKDADGLDRA